MTSLPPPQRRLLQNTVLAARNVAEEGARKALHTLGVDEPDAPQHLSMEERELRVALRAQARQLGDAEDPGHKGRYTIDHLSEKVAYDQWHRLLFARFLAENDLLISPEHGVGVSLHDCEELAPSLGLTDGWAVAVRFAAGMLPQIFRSDDPAGQIHFAPEDRTALRKLVLDLPRDIFLADDALGWVYQYWQAQRKEQVNESGKKIGAAELSPVTQLFTEDYMVEFLLHNTLGAWWSGRCAARQGSGFGVQGSGEIGIKATSEEEARAKVGLSGIEWRYLRFVKIESTPATVDANEPPEPRTLNPDTWTPAAGTFPGWPQEARLIRLLDPCMGSGHFLVFALPLLVAMRMAEEGLSKTEAVKSVLRDNIFGLELDPRCTQIAAFNLAFAAWRMAGYQALPPLNLACSGLGIHASKADWLRLAETNSQTPFTKTHRERFSDERSKEVHSLMEEFFDLFKQAPLLGSLIQPRRREADLVHSSYDQVAPLLEKALKREDIRRDPNLHEMAVTAQGLAYAADILAGQFTLVITNVPYLGRGKQEEALRDYCTKHHPAAKADLATCFVERCLAFCGGNVDAASSRVSPAEGTRQDAASTIALVTPQNWLFLGTYKALRTRLLKEQSWNLVTRLGPRAFETITGEIVNVALVAITTSTPHCEHTFNGLDVADEKGPKEKDSGLRSLECLCIRQSNQILNPDSRVRFAGFKQGSLLSDIAEGLHGQGSFDDPCFVLSHWEMPDLLSGWVFQQTTGARDGLISGCTNVFRWEEGRGMLANLMSAKAVAGYTTGKWRAGLKAWGKPGVAVSGMGTFVVNLYGQQSFDTNVAVIFPENPNHLLALWCFLSDDAFQSSVREIDQNLKVSCNTYVKVPFDLAHWQAVAAEKYPNGLPKPFSNDPTQWLFDGFPRVAGASSSGREQSNTPEQDAPTTTALQVTVARLLGYRWPRQTGSEFPDCPALGKDGLERFADTDGIVCLNLVRGEQPAAERLRALLVVAFEVAGASSSGNSRQKRPEQDAPATLDAPATVATIQHLLAAVGYAGKSLEEWLRHGFFDQHCQLFHQRPFVWQVWDGLRDGFSVLLNYHKLTRANLEKVTFTYLGDWISRQQAAVAANEEGSDARLSAALELKRKLELILAGEPPYDIFVRWKPLSKQPIGWDPDLNDGVRLNIRPFVLAGILRKPPRINWNKDRGTEPERPKEEYPWFWGWDGQTVDFPGRGEKPDGNRWNDCHYSTISKHANRNGRQTTHVKQ